MYVCKKKSSLPEKVCRSVCLFEMFYPHFPRHLYVCNKKSRSGDTLGPVELILWTEQSNQGDQGDRREQDDQGEVSIIIFGMSE